MSTSYPLIFNDEEILRLNSQSENLSDELLVQLGASSSFCLEIGCGTGSNIPLLRKNNKDLAYYGVDISSTAIKSAQDKYSNDRTFFLKTDGNSIPLNPETFDLVVIRLVLWGASNREEIVSQAKSLLKKDGLIYCYEPDDQCLMLHPKLTEFEQLIKSWQSQVMSKGCDPFIGRKLPSLFSSQGFRNIRVKPNFKTYTQNESKDYVAAVSNLLKIFRPDAMDDAAYSKICENAKIVSSESFLSEGYISLVAQK